MKIYTSYYANEKHLPKDIIRISISLYQPRGVLFYRLSQFCPNSSILSEYKSNPNEQIYTKRFNSEILGKLNKNEVIELINNISNGRDLVLLCYEKSGSFCHRSLVAKYLRDIGFDCEEWVE